MDKIAIIGLGLIGGSIGLGLKQAKIRGLEVVGYDAEIQAGKMAARLGAVDTAAFRLPDAVEGANMVIVATPVLAIRETLETIATMVTPGCVVTDTGSTKEDVMSWADEYLPREVSFVGGHPMAGKEESGIDNADPELFQGSRYVIIPSESAGKEAVKTVLDMVQLLGARAYFMDAFEHDSYVASVSHLPILLSTALVSATSKSPAWRDMSRLAATGFRDVTRLASGDPVMSLDICVTNREGIVHWINEAIKELQQYRDMVSDTVDEEGVQRLGEAFAKAWEAREGWLARYESGRDYDDDQAAVDLPTSGQQMADMLFGSRLRQRYKQIVSLQERKGQERRQGRLRRP